MAAGHRTDTEPEVGIEPTTYRLQDGRYPLTRASTCDSSTRLDNMNHSNSRELTQSRVMNRVTRHSLIRI
jgi:hypothetical protein